jgi:hypothetical protein
MSLAPFLVVLLMELAASPGWVSALFVLSTVSGQDQGIPVYPGCVSVLLHAFSWMCLLSRCYMNTWFSRHIVQVVFFVGEPLV